MGFRQAVGRQCHADFVQPLGGFADAGVCVHLYSVHARELGLHVVAVAIALVEGAFDVPTPGSRLMRDSLSISEVGLGVRELSLEARSGSLSNNAFEPVDLGAQLVGGHRGQILSVNGVDGSGLSLAPLRLEDERFEGVWEALITSVEVEMALAVRVGEIETQLVARAARCRGNPLLVEPG